MAVEDRVIQAFVFRHLQTARDHLDRKLDVSSPFGRHVQLPRVIEEVGEIPSGGVRYFASAGDVLSRATRVNRAYDAAQEMAYQMGVLRYDDQGRVLTPEAVPIATSTLNPMRLGLRFREALEHYLEGDGSRTYEESQRLTVAFKLNSAWHIYDDGTETPTQVGERYARHIEGDIAGLFRGLMPGEHMKTFSWGHEPCLTALALHYLGSDIGLETLGGPAKTAEGIRFELRQTERGLVAVTMQYRDHIAEKEIQMQG